MISITLDSEQVWLLPYRPDGDQFRCEWSLPNAMQVGVTMRETRDRLPSGQRRKVRYSSTLSPTEKASLDTAIKIFGDRRVLVPWWPSARLYAQSDTGTWYGQINLFWNGGGTPAVGACEVRRASTPSSLTPNATTQVVPLILCRFDDLPRLIDSTPQGWAAYDFSAFQVGKAADDLASVAATLTNGASINGQSVPKLTIPCDFLARKKDFKVRIESREVGYSREPLRTFYTHEPRAVHKVTGLAIGNELKYLATLISDRSFSLRPFWLEKEDAPGTFIYGRLGSDVIELNWRLGAHGARELCEFSFEFQTLPSEETLPSGEIYGQTIGPKSEITYYGYRISNSGTTVRWTSAESDLTGPDGTYLRRRIEHGRTTEKENLELSPVTLTVGEPDTSNPFLPLLTQPSAEPLTVEILRWTASNPAGAVAVYSGKAISASTDGPLMQVRIKPFTSFLRTAGPRWQLTQTCSAEFGDIKCTMPKTGTLGNVSSYSGGVLTFSANLGFGTDDLVGGWVERPMPDGSKQRYTIAKNGVSTNTWIQVIGTVVPAPTGTESGWRVVKTCNRTFTSCQALGNAINFRGFPHIPSSNPAMVPVRDTAQGGKK